MQTQVISVSESTVEGAKYSMGLDNAIELRCMSEADWIERYASGTLRKLKRLGFAYMSLYREERTAWTFGWQFEIVPKSRITFGDPIAEGNSHPITEAGWHIDRYIQTAIFIEEKYEAKYIYVDYGEGKKEGVGIIVRSTCAKWVPEGHIVFAIVTEFDKINNKWLDAKNPF